jgi:hypothetical protein
MSTIIFSYFIFTKTRPPIGLNDNNKKKNIYKITIKPLKLMLKSFDNKANEIITLFIVK